MDVHMELKRKMIFFKLLIVFFFIFRHAHPSIGMTMTQAFRDFFSMKRIFFNYVFFNYFNYRRVGLVTCMTTTQDFRDLFI